MDLEPKENSELLYKAHNVELTNSDIPKSETNGRLPSIEVAGGPPDGGFRAISVLVGSFLTNGLLFGVINSFGVIFEQHGTQLQAQGVANAKSKLALVGALAMGITFLLSPVSGALTALLGLRATAVLGGSLATTGLLLSSFAVDHVEALYFTYGVLYGLGASLAYTPSLAVLGHYFKKYLGIVNGIVTIGSSVFTVIMVSLIKYLITNHGLYWTFRVLAIFTFGIALCGLLFKPIPLLVIEKPPREKTSFHESLVKAVTNGHIWRNMKYRFWALSMPVALFGYFVPYIHMEEYIKLKFVDLDKSYASLPIQCLSVTSGMGRLLFGFLADKPGIDRIFLQQISFYVIGSLTIILPYVNTFWVLVVITCGMGVFDGAFIALIGPIAFELVGSAHAAQAIGCMLGLAAAPLSTGPPVAAAIREYTGSYTLPFVLAGISPLVGASLMFAIRLHRRAQGPTNDTHANGRISLASNDVEKLSNSSRIPNGDDQRQTSL